MTAEKFTAVFLMTVLIGLGVLSYASKNQQSTCIQSAMTQNYAADQIKKICR